MLPPDSQSSGAGQQPGQAEGAVSAAVGGDTVPQAAALPEGDTAVVQVTPADQADGGARAAGTNGQVSAPARRPLGRARAVTWRAVAPVTRTLRRLRPTPASEAARVRPAHVAGSVLARLTVIPALLIMAWLIPGLPLLLGGHFLPVPTLLIAVPLAVALIVNGLRVVPASWPRQWPRGRVREPGWTAWFGLLATVAVVAGLIAWQLSEASQALIVLRDPGTYLQAGYWIAQHGSLPIPETLTAFGGAHLGLNFSSTGFMARGTSLYPAVTPGLPLLLAGGFWVQGSSAATAVGPVLGGLAVLAFAGLVARLVGPQWAPAGALILGLSLPEQYAGRTSLSETALQVMLFGGLSLLVDSLALRGALRPEPRAVAQAGAESPGSAKWPIRARLRDWRLASAPRFGAWFTPQRVLAGLAGLALGFGLLISLDGLLYLLPVIPFCCVLAIGRRPQATTFLVGLVISIGYAIAGCYLLDRPFLGSVAQPVALAGVAAVWLIAMCTIAFQLVRMPSLRRAVPRALARRPLRWLPDLGGLLVVAALIGFAIRPYVQTVHGRPSRAVASFISSLQRLQGLPVDPTRLYSEQTLYWVIWYVGLPTVLLGGFGIALLAHRCLRALISWRDAEGVWRGWGLPLALICAGSLVVLWAPDIVPDQPWASRRLIVVVIPGLIICALWAASALARRARDRGARPVTAAVAGLFCSAAMLVPTVSTTFGLGLSHTGKSGGLAPTAQGMALRRTGVGQVAAIRALCAQIPRDASVVILDWTTAQQFTQVIRGMCGVPAAWMVGQPRTSVDRVIASIAAAGRRPLLLASRRATVAAFGGAPVRVLDLVTTTDPDELTQLPTSPTLVRFQIWMTAPGVAGIGT